MFRFWIPRCMVWITRAGHNGVTHNGVRFRVGVVEQHAVAHLHIVAHCVTRRIVADAIPLGFPAFLRL